MKKYFYIVAFCVLAGTVAPACSKKAEDTAPPIPKNSAKDPINASYIIDGREIELINGIALREIAPGSAGKAQTRIMGKPVYGFLDEDDIADALVLLADDNGGSGTFYYMAAAMGKKAGESDSAASVTYEGTNAILLGDRIAPQNIAIRNGIAIANYADRKSGEPMTANPGEQKSKYALVQNNVLEEIGALKTGERILEGYCVFGNEVSTFSTCQNEIYWLKMNSPAFNEIKKAYSPNLGEGIEPYRPLFMILGGTVVPADKGIGFESDYEWSFEATRFIKAPRLSSCLSDWILLDDFYQGKIISSPFTVTGFAKGNWFFEASFPIVVVDWDGRIIGKGIATAKDEWMTEKFVPFEGKITFEKPAGAEERVRRGAVIFRRDNPSDLPENDAALEIQIYFK
jgi:hypothetical protein